MKRLLAVFFMTMAATAVAEQPKLSGVQLQCELQARMIIESYRLYKQGADKDYIMEHIRWTKETPKSRAWLGKVVDGIFSDSRSMFVNETTTATLYGQKCMQDPSSYIRDPDLIE